MILLMTTDISNIDYDKYITESVADEDDYNAHIIVLKLLLKRYIYFFIFAAMTRLHYTTDRGVS